MLTNSGLVFFRLLINTYFSGKLDALSTLLPKEEYDRSATVQYPHKNPLAVLFQPDKWVQGSDCSWMEVLFFQLPASLQSVYLNIFPEEIVNHLRSKMESSPTDTQQVTYTEPVREFLLGFLHSQNQDEEITPKELLPEVELSCLLEMTRAELLEIIDLLAIHDLVDEVRHIVDKRTLQALLQLLTSQQQNYLRICLRQKAKTLPGSSKQIHELLKDGKKFSSQLHKQGLQKLGVALSGYNQDFLWYITHRLDMQRAKFLQQYIRPEALPSATRLAQLQVLHIIQFLKTIKAASSE
ncbi:MAG: hypothetical protein JSR46_07410 [Verrucomicrobia bacterium]|nr:hypothetical protein [Verrucomicrobiota bacterium]